MSAVRLHDCHDLGLDEVAVEQISAPAMLTAHAAHTPGIDGGHDRRLVGANTTADVDVVRARVGMKASPNACEITADNILWEGFERLLDPAAS